MALTRDRNYVRYPEGSAIRSKGVSYIIYSRSDSGPGASTVCTETNQQKRQNRYKGTLLASKQSQPSPTMRITVTPNGIMFVGRGVNVRLPFCSGQTFYTQKR